MWRGRERGREKIPSMLHAVSTEANVGLDLMNCEIMTSAKIKSQKTDSATQVSQDCFIFYPRALGIMIRGRWGYVDNIIYLLMKLF